MRILKKEISGLTRRTSLVPRAPGHGDGAAPRRSFRRRRTAPVSPPAASAAPDAQAQIAALQEQLNNIQQTVGANGTTQRTASRLADP